MNAPDPRAASAKLHALGQLAVQLGQDPTAEPWPMFEQSAASIFGPQHLFTVLAYDRPRSLMCRLYSNRNDISPVGGMKRVTASLWSAHVLEGGAFFVGSSRADIQKVFSEYESLWKIGCESVLNLPLRHRGVTIGTINLLGNAGQYDQYDPMAAHVFAQLAVPYLMTALTTLANTADAVDPANLISV